MKNEKCINQWNRGMTILEILLYVALLTVMLLAVSAFVAVFMEARIKNQVIAEVEQQAITVMQSVTQTVRNAESIVLPAPGAQNSSLTVDVYDYADNTVFDLAGDAVRITEDGGAAIPLTSSRVTVSGLTFNNLTKTDTPGTVRVSFTVTYNAPAPQKYYQYSKSFITSASIRGSALGGGGGGGGGCMGTATVCAAFGDAISCGLQSGCSWDTVWSCDGATCDCTLIGNQADCDGADACTWETVAGSCSSSGSESCWGIPDQTTCEAAGCTWWFGMCSWFSTPDCASISDEAVCTAATCTWTPPVSSCDGTCSCVNLLSDPPCTSAGCLWDFSESCSGTAADCSTFGGQSACESQAGCSWS